MDDQSNLYFLHYSDNPGLVLVSQLLTKMNYVAWSRSMIMSLTVKNKIVFIDGTITEPDKTDVDLHQAWERNNFIVMTWILNSVSKEISASIIFSDSTRSIWSDLKDRF